MLRSGTEENGLRCVVLIGDSGSAADRRHIELFKSGLGVSDGEALAAKELFFSADGGLLLAQTSGLERMPRGGVVVFEESFSERHGVCSLTGCSAVVSSENEAAVRLLSGADAQTVTCGLSGKDTVTITSFTGDTAMIALQRELVSCSGERVQPGEFPVRLRRIYDRYAIMSLAATRLLLG